MKKILLLLFVGCTPILSQAQLEGQALIDSLLTQLPKMNEDTNKVKLLNDLGRAYYSIDPDEGLKYGKQGLALAEALNWKKGIAYACKGIAGNYGYGKSDYSKALEYSLRALQHFEEMGDEIGKAKMLGDIGVVYWYQSDYPNALKYFFDALKINEERGIKRGMAETLGNIGILYYSQEDYPKALEYILKANEIDEELGNKSGVATNLGNIGELYMTMSDTTKALEYQIKSLRLHEELGDRNGIARTYLNIGTIYVSKRDYNKSLEYFFKSLKLNEDLGNKMGIATNLGNIGGTYLEIVNNNSTASKSSNKTFPRNTAEALKQAKVYTENAINIFREIGDLSALFNNYMRLSEIQSLLGDNKGALESYKQYTLLKDSVFDMEKDKKLTETAMQYEFDKKEALTKAEQEKKDVVQRNIRNSFIAGAALLLSLLIGLINRYRYKQKANKDLAAAYEHLKATQEQLVQSEKMAAFGVMATRMAHEIQNPLNFVNNFSQMCKELIHDLLSATDEAGKKETADLLINNFEKINHHGKRAAGIINQLQEHARAGTAQQFFEEEKNK